MILTEIFQRQEQPLSGFVPSKKWLEKGLEIVFVGDQMVWSRRAVGGCLTLTKTGGPKTQMTKFGRMPGFGTTYGTGTTDRLDSAFIPPPTSGWRSIVSHYYANTTGGGGLGRIFQHNSGPGNDSASGGESFYIFTGMAYNRLTNAVGGQWITPAITTGRWQSAGLTHDQRTLAVVPIMFLDGAPVSVSTSSTPTGTYNSAGIQSVWGDRTTGARNWDGIIGPTLIFDGALTAEDHAAIDRNPWQVFEPEFPELWVQPAVGGGGGTFQPASAMFLVM